MKYINLLPKSKQQDVFYERLFSGFIRFTFFTVALMLCLVMVEVGVKIYLSSRISMIERGMQKLNVLEQKNNDQDPRQDVRKVNNTINDFNTLTTSTPVWSKVLEVFTSHVPAGVTIKSLSASNDKGEVQISGFSETREAVIELYNNIATDTEHFMNIDYPLENVTKPRDVSFHFTFTLRDTLIKPIGSSK